MASSSSPIDPRRLVGITAERATHVSNTDFPGHYPGEDLSWDLQKFNQNTTVRVTRLSNRQIEFDIIGVDASIANAFRRIMIAEIPSVAIERVYIFNNTTVIQDEVLAHRLGLVPLNVDPTIMDFRDPTDENLATDRNTIVFKVDLTCTRKAPTQNTTQNTNTNPKNDEIYTNHELLSSHLVWHPAGEQSSVFAHRPPGPTNPNIVLAKLRPGQEVSMELHAVKGVGKDHAKFSPVATASYRLHPHIQLTPSSPNPIPADQIEKFQKCFAPGVILLTLDGTPYVDEKAMRRDPVTREVLRHEEFKDKVVLGRVRDWFIFGAESEGPYAPERLLPEAIKVMRGKMGTLRKSALGLLQTQTQTQKQGEGEGGGDVTMAEP